MVPLIGLTIGVIIGLLNKPSDTRIAAVIDTKINSGYYLPTIQGIVSKESINDIEKELLIQSNDNIAKITEKFPFEYNHKYLSLFVIIIGLAFVIIFIPFNRTPSSPNANPVLSQTDALIISGQLNSIKTDTNTPEGIRQTISQLEELLAKIQKNPQVTLLIESMDFLRQKLSLPDNQSPEYAKLQAIMGKLQEILGNYLTGQASAQNPDNASHKSTFSLYQPDDNRIPVAPAPITPTSVQAIEIGSISLQKTYEQAINNPYLPEDYKNIIKKYFSR